MFYNYAEHFGQIIKREGKPDLSNDQFKRFMNIVYQCGVIKGIEMARKYYENTEDVHKVDMETYLQSKKLTKETGNLPPEIVLKDMYKKSHDDF